MRINTERQLRLTPRQPARWLAVTVFLLASLLSIPQPLQAQKLSVEEPERPRLLLVGAPRSVDVGFLETLIDFSDAAGVRVVVADANPQRLIPTADHQHFDFLRFDDAIVPAEALQIVQDYLQPLDGGGPRLRLVGVYTLREANVVLAAHIAAAYGLPGLSVEAARNADHKRRMREVWHQMGIPSPAYREIRATQAIGAAIDEAHAVIEELLALGRPVALKPVRGVASIGLQRIDSVAEIDQAVQASYEQCLIFGLHERPGGRLNHWIVEQWIDGLRVAVDSIKVNDTVRVLGMAVKWPQSASLKAPETLYLSPNQLLNAETLGILEKRNRQVVAGLRGDGFHVNVDYILTPGGVVYPLEVNGRSTSGVMPYVFSQVSRSNFYPASLQAALGYAAQPELERLHSNDRPFALLPTYLDGKGAAVQVFDGNQPLLRRALLSEDVHWVQMIEPDGLLHHDEPNLIGYILATADTVNAAIAKAEAVQRRLQVGVDPEYRWTFPRSTPAQVKKLLHLRSEGFSQRLQTPSGWQPLMDAVGPYQLNLDLLGDGAAEMLESDVARTAKLLLRTWVVLHPRVLAGYEDVVDPERAANFDPKQLRQILQEQLKIFVETGNLSAQLTRQITLTLDELGEPADPSHTLMPITRPIAFQAARHWLQQVLPLRLEKTPRRVRVRNFSLPLRQPLLRDLARTLPRTMSGH